MASKPNDSRQARSAGPTTETVVDVWNGELRIHVKVAGKGPPLLYLHPAGGLIWDEFLDDLCERYTVYAPEHPGSSASDPHAIHKVDSFYELLLIYEEVIRALKLERPILVGQSYGGMLAADLAAHYPNAFSRLVLLAPIGMWRDDAPIRLVELMSSPPDKALSMLFHDVTSPSAAALAPQGEGDEIIKNAARAVWTLGCTAKFCWPIADYGLSRRLFRIICPTLIVWGEQDALVPVAYAQEFAKGIRGSRTAIIGDSGHIPQMEQTAATIAAVEDFLRDQEIAA